MYIWNVILKKNIYFQVYKKRWFNWLTNREKRNVCHCNSNEFNTKVNTFVSYWKLSQFIVFIYQRTNTITSTVFTDCMSLSNEWCCWFQLSSTYIHTYGIMICIRILRHIVCASCECVFVHIPSDIHIQIGTSLFQSKKHSMCLWLRATIIGTI